MLEDRIISIGAVAVSERMVRHDDAYEALLRQDRSSEVDNILIHQIGGQEQLAGMDPVEALVGCLEFIGDSRVVAFRAEFDATVFEREVRRQLGYRAWPRFIDLAALLPAMFPGTENDTLDDWVAHFGLPPIGRHHAIADAYATAQLLMIVLEAAPRSASRPPQTCATPSRPSAGLAAGAEPAACLPPRRYRALRGAGPAAPSTT